MATAATALAKFRAAVGEDEFSRVVELAEISRLANGTPPETEDDAEVERLAKLAE